MNTEVTTPINSSLVINWWRQSQHDTLCTTNKNVLLNLNKTTDNLLKN